MVLSSVTGCTTARTPNTPTNAAEEQVVKLVPFEMKREDVDPSDPNYLRAHLKPFGLAPLSENPRPDLIERYRFLWTRTFHPAVLFEVEFKADGTGTYRANVWKDKHGSGRWVMEATHRLKQGDLDFFRHLITSYDLFKLPWSDGRAGYDGSSWFIELQRGEQHHEIYRWSPEEGPVKTFGMSLIEQGIDSVLIPIY